MKAILWVSAVLMALIVGVVIVVGALVSTVAAAVTGSPELDTTTVTDTNNLDTAADVQPATVTTPSSDGDYVSARGFVVHYSIRDQVTRLVDAAAADSVYLGGWGYRSTDRQIELRRKHCGTSEYAIWRMPSSQCSPPTARPGWSMHEKGLAIDFTCDGERIAGTPCFDWLVANAELFGLYNLPSEPWHWSTNGR